MNEITRRVEPPDLSHFHDNWCDFPPEQLVPFYEKYVAWSADGTRIVASGETEEELDQNLIAQGIALSQVVREFLAPPE